MQIAYEQLLKIVKEANGYYRNMCQEVLETLLPILNCTENK